MPDVIDDITGAVAAPPRPIAPPSVMQAPPPQSTPDPGGGGGGGGGGGAPASTPAPAPTAMPSGGWASWKDVPTGEQNWISGQVDLWEQTTGFQVPITSDQMLKMVNAGVQTQHDLGQYVSANLSSQFSNVLATMPWAAFGLDKDTYAAMSETFGTEYKKITGQDITKEALQQAFQNPADRSGGLLTASQYTQQLMNDQSIQNTYGWVKYGLDFSAWTQQKLSMRSGMGRDVTNAEAAAVLQYNKAATGATANVTARQTGQQTQQQPAGVGGSVAR